MNAIPSPRPPLKPTPNRQGAPRRSRHLRSRSHQAVALEVSAKMVVNMVISAAAVSALVQLLPYHWSQQEKLREIRTEVKLLEGRVNSLHKEFSRNFDPQQTKNIMQEQSSRIDPTQRQVFLMNKDDPEQDEPQPSSY